MQVYDNVFTDDEYTSIVTIVKNLHYSYGWSSANKSKHDTFFNSKIADIGTDNRRDITHMLEEPYSSIWEHIKQYIGDNTIVIRCYSNMQVHGLESFPHRDVPYYYDTDKSIVIYCTLDNWLNEYGGSTLEYLNNGTVSGYTFKKNRTVIFNSSNIHQAMPLSKSCHLSRNVLVFKTRQPSIHEDYFISKDWDKLKHGKGTFFNHLMRTAYECKKLDCNEDTYYASMYHAVLGTEFFKPVNIATEEELRTLISDRSIELVKQFSNLPRLNRLSVAKDISDDLYKIAIANDKSQFTN